MPLGRLRSSPKNAANERMSKLDKKSPEFATARDELKTVAGKIKEGEAELDGAARKISRHQSAHDCLTAVLGGADDLDLVLILRLPLAFPRLDGSDALDPATFVPDNGVR